MGSRKIQNTISAVVLLLALIALFFQDRIFDWWQDFSSKDNRPVIAEITDLSNNVRYRLPESLTYRRAKASQALRAKDTVSTDIKSTAVITFKSGLQFELEPNSLITIEDTSRGGGTLEVTFLKGSVKVLNQGKSISLSGTALRKELVSREPKIDISMLALPSPAPAIPLPHIALEEKKEKKKPVVRKKEEKETLPDSYIASIIRNQKAFLNRCYAQHLRLNPDARGRIDCSLTIEPDGSVSTSRVIASSVSDPTLQQCVVSTLQRTKFKSFNGDPIIVNYPINFE